MTTFRGVLWSSIDSLFDSLHTHTHMVKMLCKKVDPMIHKPFISVRSTLSLVLNSWSKITALVKES